MGGVGGTLGATGSEMGERCTGGGGGGEEGGRVEGGGRYIRCLWQ